jgi:uncharacterized damage-inducible protein DinB
MLELKQIRQNLWDTISDVTDETINQTLESDQWNIAQVLEHLYLVERAIASQLVHGIHEESEHPLEEKNIDIVLDRSMKISVSNPMFEPTSEFQTLASLKTKSDKSRQQFTEAMQSLDSEQLEFKGMPMPYFGLLSLKQWIQFASLHEQRHIEQIRELLQVAYPCAK